MPHEIKMPPLSQTSDEVRLLKWLVNVGDTLKKGDPLCEVENDKSVMPLESVAAGTVLALSVEEGASVTAGSVIAVLGEKGETLPGRAAGTILPGAASATARASTRTPDTGGIKISHIARNVAEKRGINLSRIQGTGPGGRIVLKDLDAAAASPEGARSTAATAAPPAPAAASRMAAPPVGASATVPFTPFQAIVARNLVKSKAEIPHFYVTMEIEVSGLLQWISTTHRATGNKPSFYSALVFAAARALKKHPRVNASSRPDGLIILPTVDIAIAVAVGDELFAPVVKGADRMGLEEINSNVKWLIAKAQNKRLEPGDQSGGTFTISNLGVYPVDEFTAIISPPQSGILAIGGKKKVLSVADDNSVSIREVMKATGSFDHRIVNGALAAEFLTTFKHVIEKELI
jgi:pyruvate dehydrogenase E2 component (dihydrolipoamide acetyltransferase)